MAKEKRDPETTNRAIWSGSISFGLVQIPVKLLTLEKSSELSFHQIDKRNKARIRYERVNEETGEKVEWGQIIKGYELPNGRVVPIEEGDFEKANVKATHTIDIQDFVKKEEISPTYFERPYFLVPDRADKAYAVLRDALIRKDYVAIGLVVIRTRQHLCAIMPDGEGMILEILRFASDLKSAAKSKLPGKVAASSKEVAMAEQLVESMAGEWKPSKYADTFKDDMLKAIEKKAKTGKLPAVHVPKSTQKVGDLMALLKKSVQSPRPKHKSKRRAA